MVGGRCHGAEAVVASRETTVDSGREKPLAVTSVVDTLEEGKLGGIERRGRVLRVASVLDGNVGVANDVSAAIQILRSGIVGGVRVGECTRGEVDHLNRDIEVRVGLNSVAILGAGEDTGHHVVGRRNLSHNCGNVSRATRELGCNLPMPLQDPPCTCWPLVSCWPSQKLMKLALSLLQVSFPSLLPT